ncbi:RpiR/GlvR family transcriptional regulator [Cupriavidus basilensis OR16]|uniref:RpiR/GlvR family transcriptional regulator n=1 Tax=Cupriavidus basilensis OR16 TaxID=1127483 RepID=H1S418_9BURK|nr:RpiR/GlvR family transcriptional regulator [Cupriavidus basilensis OR16]
MTHGNGTHGSSGKNGGNGSNGSASIAERIARALPTLTPAHQRMAEYVLGNPFRAATMRIDEFADAVAVSVATANRFAHALGFEGFPQFRAELVRGFEATLAPVEKLRTELARPATVAEVFAASLEEDVRNLEASRRALDAETCERAVEAILAAERIFVVGFGASGFLAGLLQHGLDMSCRTVISVSGAGGASTAARQLFKLQPRDLLIVIGFPRYVYDTVTIAKRARSHGARILALTDGPTSPLAPLADIALYAQAGRQLSANSDAAVLAFIEALCGAVAYRAAHAVKAAAEMTEFLLPWLHGAPPDKGGTRVSRATTKRPKAAPRPPRHAAKKPPRTHREPHEHPSHCYPRRRRHHHPCRHEPREGS